MSAVNDQIIKMFARVAAGTVTQEEGTMLINSLAKKEPQETVQALQSLIHDTPPDMSAQLVFRIVAMSRSRFFFDILTSALDHKNEDMSIFACEELSKYFPMESQFVLGEHLNSEVYAVRKASARILTTKVFGNSGIDTLKKHILANAEHYYRLSSAEILADCGENGIAALMQILNSGKPGPASTVAEVLGRDSSKISDANIPVVLNALLEAGDAQQKESLVALLKLVASLGPRARLYIEYVRAYEDWEDELVNAEAWNALMEIDKGMTKGVKTK